MLSNSNFLFGVDTGSKNAKKARLAVDAASTRISHIYRIIIETILIDLQQNVVDPNKNIVYNLFLHKIIRSLYDRRHVSWYVLNSKPNIFKTSLFRFVASNVSTFFYMHG